MLNIVICITSFALAIVISFYEINKTRNNTLKYAGLWMTARFVLFLTFGFFLSESIKWLVGIKTLIF